MEDKNFEKLSAYRDGETSSEDTVDIQKQLEEQEEMRNALLRLNSLDAGTKAVFDEMLNEPVSEDHIHALGQAFDEKFKKSPDEVVSFTTQEHDGASTRLVKNRWVPAIAASIAAVLISAGIGLFAFEQYDANVTMKIAESQRAANEKLASLLQDTLETKVSGKAAEFTDPAKLLSMKIIPIHTYKSNSGHWCREFSERIESNGVVEVRKGLACRETQGQWKRLSTTIEGESSGKL